MHRLSHLLWCLMEIVPSKATLAIKSIWESTNFDWKYGKYINLWWISLGNLQPVSPTDCTFNPLMGFAAPQIRLVNRPLGGAYDSCPSRGANRPCSGYLALAVSTYWTWGNYCPFGGPAWFQGANSSFFGGGRFIPNFGEDELSWRHILSDGWLDKGCIPSWCLDLSWILVRSCWGILQIIASWGGISS